LDFGTDKVSTKLYVSKNYTAQPLPTFSVSSSAAWITVTPSMGDSTGPSSPAEFTVTVNRSLLAAGDNTGSVAVTAPGISPLSVPVTAKARIAANFEGSPLIIQLGEAVDFVDLSGVASGEAAINSWTWDFGDGTSSTLQNPQKVYAVEGVYDVTLTVGNGTLADTEEKIAYVAVEGPQGPTAAFIAATQTPVVGALLQFTDQSSSGSAAQIDTWAWDFGDGGTSNLQNPTHTYNTVATFTVALTVTTTIGSNTLTRTNYITVQPILPNADFTVNDQNPGVGEMVTFTDTSIPGSGPINTWLWNFGDGNVSPIQSPSHVYNSVAQYTVSLTVTTIHGSDTETKLNHINVHAKKFLERQGSEQ
jgi:PKD repeat protein